MLNQCAPIPIIETRQLVWFSGFQAKGPSKNPNKVKM